MKIKKVKTIEFKSCIMKSNKIVFDLDRNDLLFIFKLKLSKLNALRLRFDRNTNVYRPKELLISTDVVDANFVFTMSEIVIQSVIMFHFFHNRL